MKTYPFGHYTVEDLEAMNEIIHQYSVKNPLLEIGCKEGRSTSVLAQFAKEQRQILYCIDPFFGGEEPPYKEEHAMNFIKNMVELGLFDNIRILPITSQRAAEITIWEKISILHLDGSHLVENLTADIRNYLYKTEQLVIFHDINYPDVKVIFEELLQSGLLMVFRSEYMGICKC